MDTLYILGQLDALNLYLFLFKTAPRCIECLGNLMFLK